MYHSHSLISPLLPPPSGVPHLHVSPVSPHLHQVYAGLDDVGGAGRDLRLGPDRRALPARAAQETGGDRAGQERAALPGAHLLVYVPSGGGGGSVCIDLDRVKEGNVWMNERMEN